jgi:hypothetical protein
LLPRVLYLLQTQASPVVLEPLLELLNQHLTSARLAEQAILEEERDALVALQIVLLSSQQQQQEQHQPSISLSFRVLIGTLLEYWVQCLLLLPNNNNDDDDDDYDGWLQRQFLLQQQQQHQQQGAYPCSPEQLRRNVEDFLGRIEHYGMELLESALHLLEEHGAEQPSVVVVAHPHGHRRGHGDNNTANNDNEQVVTVLQYVTLATNFLLVFLQQEEKEHHPVTAGGNSIFRSTLLSGMGRSLWRALCQFVVQRMEHNNDNDITNTINTTNINANTNISLDCQVAATDALWRLAQTHPPGAEDVALVTTTIFRLWKHSDYHDYWNKNLTDNNNEDDEEDTALVQWIREQLQCPNYGKSLRHALQAAILSVTYLPTNKYPRGPLSTLAELVVLNKNKNNNSNINTDDEEDPWQSLVLDQLTEYAAELQQQHQNQHQLESQKTA